MTPIWIVLRYMLHIYIFNKDNSTENKLFYLIEWPKYLNIRILGQHLLKSYFLQLKSSDSVHLDFQRCNRAGWNKNYSVPDPQTHPPLWPSVAIMAEKNLYGWAHKEDGRKSYLGKVFNLELLSPDEFFGLSSLCFLKEEINSNI